jgi:hypothetical protein
MLDANTIAATETITVSIEIKNPTSGNGITIATFTAVSAAAEWAYMLAAGASDATSESNLEVQQVPLPLCEWRVKVTHSASGTHNYSLDAAYIL